MHLPPSDPRSEQSTKERRARRALSIRSQLANLVVLAWCAIVPLEGGCMSIQVEDANTGLPKIIGWGETSSIPVREGSVTRLLSPGISLRLHAFAPGLTLGWHETLLFRPATNSRDGSDARRPVAVQTRNIGLGFVPFGVILGADRTFVVPAPEPGETVMQFLHFDRQAMSNTIVRKEELP